MKNILNVALSFALAFGAFGFALTANPSQAFAAENGTTIVQNDGVYEGQAKTLVDAVSEDLSGVLPEDALGEDSAASDDSALPSSNDAGVVSTFAHETIDTPDVLLAENLKAHDISVTSSDGTLDEHPETLAKAIALANESSADAVTITLDRGTYKATANNQFRITRDGITIQGAPGLNPANVVIEGGAYSVSGQGAILVSADNVVIKNLTVTAAAGGDVSAIKVSRIGDASYLPLVYNTTLHNLVLSSTSGHALNLHGAEGVSVQGVTISGAGKLGISLANATGVVIENTTIGQARWGADIGIMYAENDARYAIPSQVTLGEGNDYANGVIYSSRPASATADTIVAPGLAVQYDQASGGWYLLPGAKIDTLFVDEAIGTEYDSFEASAALAPNGAVLTQLDNITEPIAMPVEAEGKELTIDGNNFAILGGFEVGVAMTSLSLNNMTFSGVGFTSTEPIENLAITNSSFTGGSAGSAICISNQAGATSISSNIIENWDTSDSELSAVSIALADNSKQPLTFTGNKLSATDSSVATSAPLLKVLGSGFSGTADLSSNYWMGQDPLGTETSTGAPLADLSGMGELASELSNSLGSFYLDEDMSSLSSDSASGSLASEKPNGGSESDTAANNSKPSATHENSSAAAVIYLPSNMPERLLADASENAAEKAVAASHERTADTLDAASLEETLSNISDENLGIFVPTLLTVLVALLVGAVIAISNIIGSRKKQD